MAVTGEAGLGYMLRNLEVLLREKRESRSYINNGGFAGYGPGFGGRDISPSPTPSSGRTR